MKRLVSLIAITAVVGGAANASDFETLCARGGDERIIEVVSPGEVGAACDVRYFRGSNRSLTVPFHANNSQNFCLQKANELVNTLATAGYSCAPTESVDVADAAPIAPTLATEPTTAELVAETQPVAQAGAEIVAQAPQIETEAAAPPEATELKGKMSEILALPEEIAAVRGPADLTEQVVETPAGGRPSSVVGRLVGATPDAPPAITPVTQAALRDAPAEVETAASSPSAAEAEPALVKGPDIVKEPAPTAPAAAAERAAKPSKRASLRKTEDVIRATLSAQAAAWNEGNLDAFMEIYWKDDGLKFISNAEITKGWSSTLKRYRERYSDENGLGQLGFDQMDVELVTDDVAVITGRFIHNKADAATSGIFSLVMRRDAGAWRIVHDHTVVDSTPAE